MSENKNSLCQNERKEEDEDPFADIEWEEDVQDEQNINNSTNGKEEYSDSDELDHSRYYNDSNISNNNITLVFDPVAAAAANKRSSEDANNQNSVEQPPKKKARIKPVKFREEDYEQVLQRCEDDLATKVNNILQILTWTSDDLLVHTAQSLIDLPLQQTLQSPTKEGHTRVNILHLRNALRSQVRILSNRDITEDEGRDGSTTEELQHQVLHHRRGSAMQWLQILYLLLRSYRIRCRWVSAIRALSLHPQDHDDILIPRAENEEHVLLLQQQRKRQRSSMNLSVKGHSASSASNNSYGEVYLGNWLEIWLPNTEAFWLNMVDDNFYSTGQAYSQLLQQQLLKRYGATLYVVMVEDRRPIRTGFVLRDLTDIITNLDNNNNINNNNANGTSNHHPADTNNGRTVSTHTSTRMLQESVLRCRSWFSAHLASLCAPARAQTNNTAHSSNNNTDTRNSSFTTTNNESGTAKKLLAAAPLKIYKVGAEEVIDLLDDSEEEEEKDRDRSSHSMNIGDNSSGKNTSSMTQQPEVLVVDDSDGDHKNTLNTLNHHTSSDFLADDEDELDAQDRLLQHYALQRQQRKQQQQLPTSFQGFKNHPYYCLARFLLSDEMLHPDKVKQPSSEHTRNKESNADNKSDSGVVAIFKGENVYLRSAVEQLHTYDGWRRRLRVVRADMRDQPAKTLQRKTRIFNANNTTAGSHHSNSSANPFAHFHTSAGTHSGTTASNNNNNNNSTNVQYQVREIRYYGSWQTEVLQIPAVDPLTELIPRNEYGNLEIWDGLPQFVPAGAVYLAQPYVEKAARHLAVQYVPAVVGFEANVGANTRRPKVQGIVVLTRDGSLVTEVAWQLQELAEEKESQVKYERVRKLWRVLVGRAMARQELREKYGA